MRYQSKSEENVAHRILPNSTDSNVYRLSYLVALNAPSYLIVCRYSYDPHFYRCCYYFHFYRITEKRMLHVFPLDVVSSTIAKEFAENVFSNFLRMVCLCCFHCWR